MARTRYIQAGRLALERRKKRRDVAHVRELAATNT
jgi:hypothetical protein